MISELPSFELGRMNCDFIFTTEITEQAKSNQ